MNNQRSLRHLKDSERVTEGCVSQRQTAILGILGFMSNVLGTRYGYTCFASIALVYDFNYSSSS